jgi:hypothetical protein
MDPPQSYRIISAGAWRFLRTSEGATTPGNAHFGRRSLGPRSSVKTASAGPVGKGTRYHSATSVGRSNHRYHWVPLLQFGM